MIFLLIILVPILVIAWGVSTAVGLGATVAALFLLLVGGDAWGGSGSYRRRPPV